MTAKKSKVGAKIDGWCAKCKQDQPQVVETLKKDGSAAQVKCDTCGTSHPHKLPQAEAAAKKAGGTKRRKKGEVTFSEAEAGKARPYSMEAEYAVGEVLEHQRFGLGRVVVLRPAGKMEVAFEPGPKLLVCKDVGGLSFKRGGRSRVIAPVEVAVEEPAAEDEAETPDAVALAENEEE